jgi:hypothetical protein
LAGRVPVETVKVAEEAVAGTVTEAGAVSTLAAVFDNVTSEPPVGAAWDRVMEQDAVPFELRVLGVHCRADTRTGARRETVADAEMPLTEAVSVAD